MNTPSIALRGTISIKGFTCLQEAVEACARGEVKVELYHAIAAGLHPDGAVTISPKEIKP